MLGPCRRAKWQKEKSPVPCKIVLFMLILLQGAKYKTSYVRLFLNYLNSDCQNLNEEQEYI